MDSSITNELNPTPPKTDGDSYFELAVMGGARVVDVTVAEEQPLKINL